MIEVEVAYVESASAAEVGAVVSTFTTVVIVTMFPTLSVPLRV